jgi:hypothetical protein
MALFASGGTDRERGRELLEDVSKGSDPDVARRARQILDHMRFDEKGRPYMVGTPQYSQRTNAIPAAAPTANTQAAAKPKLNELPEPQLNYAFFGFVVLCFDKERILIGEGPHFKVLESGQQRAVTNQLPVKINSRITAIAANDQYIWLATAADGLLQLQKNGSAYRHFKRADGLLMDSIACMQLDNDRLWIGFAEQERGGVAVLRIREQTCTGFTTAPDLFGTKGRGSLAPQNSIKGIAPMRTGAFVASRYMLQSYDKNTDVWNLELNESVRCVWASLDCDYVAVGAPAGDIKVKRLGSDRWQHIDLGEENPHNRIDDIVITGHDLWAISEFRLFHVNLRQMKADAFTVLKSSRGARKLFVGDEAVRILASGRQSGTSDVLFVRKPDSLASK